jgi:hypothetical protein
MAAPMRRLAPIFAAALVAVPGMSVTSAVARAAAIAASPSWKLEMPRNVTLPGGQIYAVSCSSENACTAVGTNVSPAGLQVTLAERWNEINWQREPTPNPPGETTAADSPVLLGVSCATASLCIAVGTYTKNFTETILADIWNGQSWKAQSVPVPTGVTSAGLDAVSCVSATSCEAVGSFATNTSAGLLAESWNGTSWQPQSVPLPSQATFGGLAGVSCVSATSCEAVGFYSDGSGARFALADSWNGTSWQLQTMPAGAPLSSVSCASATFCEAVGPARQEDAGTAAEAVMWNGTSWQAQAVPVPAGANFVTLRGVSCFTTISALNFCQAVGSYQKPSFSYVTFSITWDGASWVSQPTASPGGAFFAGLNAVSCLAGDFCEAGGYFQARAVPQALAEGWDGLSWSRQHAVEPAGATSNILSSVSCVSARACEAVGFHLDSSENRVGLAEAWNGTRWRIQQTPEPARDFNGLRLVLNAVSCVSARFCMAAGASSAEPDPVETEVWDGASWQPQPFPRSIPLTSVSCTSVDFCVAVGQSLAYAWNGTSWSILPTSLDFSFDSVSCASARFCEATGHSTFGSPGYIEAWNGSTWSPQSIAVPAGAFGITLNSVSCWRPNRCEAVGSFHAGSTGNMVALAEVWNGAKWISQRLPIPKASVGSSLQGVSCSSARFCAAVGGYQTSTQGFTLVLVWNGTAWSLRATPPGAGSLSAVSCASQSCTAVGAVSFNSRGFTSTVAEAGH